MRTPSHCTRCADQFGDYLQGRLAPAEALHLDQHLRECASCRQALALEKRLRAVPPLSAPADLAAAVLAELPARPAPAGWVRAALDGAATDLAFRVLVDPLLRLDLELRVAGAPAWRLVAGALVSLQTLLSREGTKMGQCLGLPLLHAGRQVQTALAGPTDTQ